MTNFNFIRSDLDLISPYVPNPGGEITTSLDRLDANESPFDLPGELKEKLAWIYQNKIESNRYPDGSHLELKEAIAAYVNESASLNKIINANNISVGNGSDELIRSLLIATCLGNKGSILVADPTFSMYEIIAKILGISVVKVGRSEQNFEIDLIRAKKAIEQTNTPPIRVVFVVNPNSPTGNALTSDELDWLRGIPEDILVVIDEAYFEFSQTSIVGELQKHPNWAVLRTFSKAFRLATHRVGYAIAHPEIITALEKIRLPYNLPEFSLTAAVLALTHRQLILSSIKDIISDRQKLFEGLSQHPHLIVYPSSANFIFARLKNSTETASEKLSELTQKLKEKGTLIRHTGGGLRITVGSIQENNRTLDRIMNYTF